MSELTNIHTPSENQNTFEPLLQKEVLDVPDVALALKNLRGHLTDGGKERFRSTVRSNLGQFRDPENNERFQMEAKKLHDALKAALHDEVKELAQVLGLEKELLPTPTI